MTGTLNIGLVGLGVVGSEVARLLQARGHELGMVSGQSIRLYGISARNPDKDRGFDQTGLIWFDDPLMLAKAPEVDILVELVGGGRDSLAYSLVSAALSEGKIVVSANKALLAEAGNELAELAEKNATSIHFEAAVAGGISIVNTLKSRLPANRINRIYGILNGTCNYILSRMEDDGLSFKQSLQEAQNLGYAESDPTFDIDGFDTAYKLSLLSCLAFGSRIAFEQVTIEGIRSVTLNDVRRTSEFGYRIKLLGIASLDSQILVQRVQPVLVSKSCPLADVHGVTNAVGWQDDLLGENLMTGPGAGGRATASAVLSDIVSAPSNKQKPTFSRSAAQHINLSAQTALHAKKPYYVSLMIKDKPGAFACVAAAMANENISLSSILQEDAHCHEAPELKCVIIITHDTDKGAIERAASTIRHEGVTNSEPVIFAIEDLT